MAWRLVLAITKPFSFRICKHVRFCPIICGDLSPSGVRLKRKALALIPSSTRKCPLESILHNLFSPSFLYTLLQLQLTQYVFSQQFTFNQNGQIPARFLVPGGFSVPGSNQPGQPQPKRVLAAAPQQQQQQQQQQSQSSAEEEELPRFRKPLLRPRPVIDPPSNGFGFGPSSLFSGEQTPRIPQAQDSGSAQQADSEDQTEETFSSPLSTFEPTPINTLPLRTYKPSTFQPRPTTRPPSPPFIPSSSPQPFFRPVNNINQLEDDEEEDDTPFKVS